MLYIQVGPGPLLRCHIHVGKGRWTAGISYTVVGGAMGIKINKISASELLPPVNNSAQGAGRGYSVEDHQYLLYTGPII